MLLFTCVHGTSFGELGPLAHPCGRAAKALDDAGRSCETRQVRGGSLKAWTWRSRGRDRAEVERLSGQRAVPVPVLVLDAGETIDGSGAIARWATADPAA